MVDFSNPLDKWFQDKGIQNPTTEQRKEVEEQLSDFVDSLYYDENGNLQENYDQTIFELSEDTQLSGEDFRGIVDTATCGQYTEEDYQMLYDILDSNNDGVLTYDEVSMLAKKDGSGAITSFSMWNALFGDGSYDAAPKEDSTGGTTGTGDTGTTPLPDEDGSVNPPSNPPSNPPATEPITDDPAAVTTGDANLDQLRQLIYQIVTSSNTDGYESPDDVIDKWVSAGKFPDGIDIEFSEDVIKDLRSSYWTFSEEDEGAIKAEMLATGCDRETAIKTLTDNNTIGAPLTTDETNLSKDPLNDQAVGLTADQINEKIAGMGSDMKGLEEILSDPNLTPDDIVAILKGWEEKYGKDGEHLIERIEDQWANSDKVQKLIADKLVEAAKSGNEDAAALIAQQMKSGTAEDSGTADAFLAELFKQFKDNPEILADVCAAYDGGYEQMIKDIEADHSLWWESYNTYQTGQGYIDQIEDAIKYQRD